MPWASQFLQPRYHNRMKIELIRVSRRPSWPSWALCLVLVWLGLGIAAVCLGAHTGQAVQLCLFKRLTGMVCPTCGLTRGLLSVLQGEIVAAWLCNPLLFLIIAIFFGASLARLFFAHSVRIESSAVERQIGWVLAIALGLANWVYVALYVG